MFLKDEEKIKDFGEDLKKKVKKSSEVYFKTDTSGIRSRYDYYQGKMDCFNDLMGVLESEHLIFLPGKEVK